MNFEKSIQQWVSLDNQLKLLYDKLVETREKKQEITKDIISYAEKNNLQSSVINISDGKLKFAETKISSNLTFKYVEKSLGEIISDPKLVNQIMTHLKTKRDVKTSKEIKRYVNTA